MRFTSRYVFQPLAALCVLLLALTTNAEPILKSAADDRSYEFLKLNNGLKVILVSDKTATVAAASLDVNIGSGDDPSDRPGLAHFLEHLLFLGTESFPDPGEYRAFINANGGSQNAYTAHENTNYYFEIEAGALDGALERFSQFFTAPLFDARYVERERNAVHAEYMAAFKNDGQRAYEAFRESINPDNSFAQFAVGSQETLADRDGQSIRDELIEFYKRHYLAGNMVLTIVGRETVDELRDLAEAYFADIPAGGPTFSTTPVPLFSPGTLPQRLNVVPNKDRRSLTLRFPIPSQRSNYDSKPVTYIAHMLGHEGPGSLTSALRRAGLANGLSAGGGFSHRHYSTFDVSVGLTPLGLEQVDAVVAMVFEAIKLITSEEPKRSRFDELARMAAINFKYQERGEASSIASAMASSAHIYPPRDIIRAGYAFDTFAPDRVKLVASFLVPRNLFMTVIASGLETDRISRYFKAPYKLASISEDKITHWESVVPRDELALPEPNPFIAENLAMVEEGDVIAVPEKVWEASGIELWHATDTTFETPLSSFYVSIRSPAANSSARNAVLTRLFVRMVNESLAEPLYAASVAGFGISVYPHLRGLSIRTHGYSDKHGLLVKSALQAVRAPTFDPGTFARVKEALTRRWANKRLDPPFRQGLSRLHNYLLEPHWTSSEMLEASQSITLADVKAFGDELFKALNIVTLSHGNVNQDEAVALAKAVQANLLGDAEIVTVDRASVVQLGPGDKSAFSINVEHDDVSVIRYYQGKERTHAERALNVMLASMLSSPFYTQLRTEQQLGYIVFASSMPLIQVPGIAFTVQSPTASVETIGARIDAFLGTARAGLEAVDAEAFARQKAAILTRLLERDGSLQERTNRYWNEMDRPGSALDDREQLAKALRTVTLDGVLTLFDSMFGEDAKQLTITTSKGALASDEVRVRDSFRAQRSRFADRS